MACGRPGRKSTPTSRVTDHLIPVVWNGRCYIFWPIFNEKSERATAIPRANNEDPDKYYEIKLAWIELRRGKWTTRKLSRRYLKYMQDRDSQVSQQDPRTFKFTARVEAGTTGSRILIDSYGLRSTHPPTPAAPPEPDHSDRLVVQAGGWETVWIQFTLNGVRPGPDDLSKLKVIVWDAREGGGYMSTRSPTIAPDLTNPNGPNVATTAGDFATFPRNYYVSQSDYRVVGGGIRIGEAPHPLSRRHGVVSRDLSAAKTKAGFHGDRGDRALHLRQLQCRCPDRRLAKSG